MLSKIDPWFRLLHKYSRNQTTIKFIIKFSDYVWLVFLQMVTIDAKVRRLYIVWRTWVLVNFPMLVSEATLLGKRSSPFTSVAGNDVFAWRWKLIDFVVMVDSRARFCSVESMRFAKNTKFWSFESTYKYFFLISDQINTLIFSRSWIIFKTFVFLYYIYSFWSHRERRGEMHHFLFLVLHYSETYCWRAGMVMDLWF